VGTIISGPSRLDVDINGKTVQTVLDEYGDVLNIPEGASVTVNGETVDAGTTLRSDDEVVFSKPLGQKG
jgi:ethanolamine utilization protein EutQ (cupin superfamily)